MRIFVFLILWAFSTSAQRMTFYYDNNYQYSVYHASFVDSSSHIQSVYRANRLNGAFWYDSLTIFKTGPFHTATYFINKGPFLGISNYNNKLFLNRFLYDSLTGDFTWKLFPQDSSLNHTPDSIQIGPISSPTNVNFTMGRFENENSSFLYSTVMVGSASPMLVAFNKSSNTFKSRIFSSIVQDGSIIGSFYYLQFPRLLKKDQGYLFTFDSLRATIFWNNKFIASNLVYLDSNLNVKRNLFVRYPVADTISETGLKHVKDVFHVNDKLITVGLLNVSIPNTLNSDFMTNEIGVMMLDSNHSIIDTIRIGKPANMLLSTGYMNTACWCNGRLFVAATLQTYNTPFFTYGFDSFQYPQGLLIARVDTPFSLAWSKRIFNPGRQFRLYDVHCLNGKMILGGLFTDSIWQTTGGVFSIEVDQDGNYLPLNTNNQEIGTSFQPYPNPFSNQLNLPVVEEGIGEFRLYDINGRLVFTMSNPEYRISLPALSSGLYVWQAESASGKIWRGKVVRE